MGFPIVTRFVAPEFTAAGGNFVASQDAAGIMQFGGRDLMSFDGERWTSTPLATGYGIRALDPGPDGRLWAAAIRDLGWFEREAGGEIFHSLLAHVPEAERSMASSWHVYATKTGAIFIYNEKVLRWDGAHFSIWPMPGTRHLRGARVGDRVFVQHKPTGIYEITDAGPVMFLPAAIAGEDGIFLLEQSGPVWTIINSKGIFTWDGGKFRALACEASDYIRQHQLAIVLRLPDGGLAIGTTDNGVVFADRDGKIASTTNELGDGERNVTSLFLDRQGGLWVVSASATYRFSLASKSQVLDARAHLPRQQLLRFAQDEHGIAILTSDSVYRLAADQRSLTAVPVPGTPFSDVHRAVGGLLVGGFRRLSLVSGDESRTVYETLNDIGVIVPAWEGAHLFMDGQSVISIAADNRTRLVYHQLPDFATSLAAHPDHSIWAGTEAAGIWHLVPDTSGNVTATTIGPANGIAVAPGDTRVAVMSDGTVLAFNRAGGWFSRNGGQRFTSIDGFPAGYVVPMRPAPDAKGRMWVAMLSSDARSYMLGHIAMVGDRAKWTPHSAEGLFQIGIPRCIFVEDSPVAGTVLWIGGTSGVLRNEVGNEAFAPQPAAPLLSAFARNAAGARAPLSIRLPYATPSIEFEFAAPDFARRSLLRLETRIDGIDRDWVPAASDSRRTLTALRDGDYTFRVRAVAETGVASEPTVLSFRIAPPWWRTAPAILGVIFALIPAGYGVYRLRLQALRRRTLELEAKVRQRTEQLEQANAAKTQFVANMSHDIRNPLNGIVGLALALEDTRLDPHQREIVATLRECTTYLSSLVDDVLDFASIEAGRVELRPGPFVARELLRSIVTTTKTDTAESGARLIVDIDPALPAILAGDAGRIQQILVNYVSNALKYAGGTIHVTATIPLGSPDEVEFAVADQGPGISVAEQATLFTKFTRLASAREHDIPGAGLGLAACRLLADIMGGSVGVVSEPGKGARFFLRLPLTRAEMPEAPADGELPNTTVLLVEDTDYNALAATAVLRRLGLTCERARTGEEALQLFATKRYNLVLLDRNLPDMDGTEIARRMRELETEGLPSILLAVTAYCTAEDRKLCLAAGMDAFVGKPLTPEKLRKVLLAAGRRMLATATFDAAAETAPANVDLSLLNYIADGDGGLDRQVDLFLASLGEHQAQLKTAADRDDLPALETAAHRVLGQARIVGATELTRLATELQDAARAGRRTRCLELRPRVLAEIAALTAAMRHRRSGALTS